MIRKADNGSIALAGTEARRRRERGPASRRVSRIRRALGRLIAVGLIWGVSVGITVGPTAAEKYALVIGIEKYQFGLEKKIPNLEFAEDDALKVKNALIRKLNFTEDNIFYHSGQNATRENILTSYYEIRNLISADDEFILYFAGHGLRDPVTGVPYWLTYKSWDRNLELEGIRVSDVLRLVREIRASRKLLILDHCYAGDLPELPATRATNVTFVAPTLLGRSPSPMPNGPTAGFAYTSTKSPVPTSAGREAVEKQLYKLYPLPPEEQTVAILAAARDTAFEHRVLKHGLLTWSFLVAIGAIEEDSYNNADGAGEPTKDGRLTLKEVLRHTKTIAKAKKEELNEAVGSTGEIIKQVIDFKIEERSSKEVWILSSLTKVEAIDTRSVDGLIRLFHGARKFNTENSLLSYDEEKEILTFLRGIRDNIGKPINEHECEARKVHDITNKFSDLLNSRELDKYDAELFLGDLRNVLKECNT